jgi:hypothetical protein
MLIVAMMAMGLVGSLMAMAQGQKPLELPPPPQGSLGLPATPVDLPAGQPQAAPAIPNDDPMQAVEAFVVRNRKEAAESIQTLTREAETLRARLQKVEAALERWKAVEAVLGRDAAASIHPPIEAIQKK